MKAVEKRCRKYDVREPIQIYESSEKRLECRPGSVMMRRDNNSYGIG